MRLVLLILVSSVWSSATIVQHVFTALTPNNSTSSALLNEGQSQHFMYVQWSNSGGTCNPDGTVYLQYSFDNAIWTNMNATARPESSHSNEVSIFAAGTFPFVRVNSLTNYTHCALDVWYVGTNTPISFPQSLLAYQTGYVTGQTAVAGGATGLLVGGSASLSLGQKAIVIYGLQVSNNHATNDGTLTLFTPTVVSDCSSGTTVVNQAVISVKASSAISYWPNSTIPYITYVDPSKGLCASASAGTMYVNVTYRLE